MSDCFGLTAGGILVDALDRKFFDPETGNFVKPPPDTLTGVFMDSTPLTPEEAASIIASRSSKPIPKS